MADPVIPGGIRVQFFFPGKSNLPEDRFVTTWAFRTEDNLPPSIAQLQQASNLVAEFFSTVNAPGVASILSYMAAAVDRTKAEARAYKLGDTVPREPTTTIYNLGANNSSQSLPSEVALVASFYSTRNLPRRRGRVYIGPFGTSVLATPASGTGIVRPDLPIRNALLGAMSGLRADATAAGLRWCVLSQADAALYDITDGWVDDAFDTQRRRGEDALSRLVWSSSV
jgi:hypothetical protein